MRVAVPPISSPANVGYTGVNAPAKTWDELAEDAKLLKAKDIVQYPIVWSWAESEALICDWATLVAAYGGSYYQDGKPVFDQAGGLQALQYMVQTMKDGTSNPKSLQFVEDDVRRVVDNGDAAFALITGVPTAAFDIEEALHGHVYGTTDRSLVLLIARDPAEARVAETLGAVLIPLGPHVAICNLSGAPTQFDLRIDWPSPASGWADATWVLFPFQWYAWHMAKAKGQEVPGMIYPGLGGRLDIKLRDQI